jgi:hypothetical protein
MFTTIINDCKDDNARGRQESRIAALTGAPTAFIGVDSDLEAGMQLIDVLDATDGATGLVLVNVAPRGGHTRKWENGTPFAYFWYDETLVISSVDGYALSAVKALGLADEVALLDTHEVAAVMEKAGFIDAPAARRIPHTQFRSFDFTPRVGAFLLHDRTVPYETYSLSQVDNLPKAIWHIDNFGNCKTTLTRRDLKPGAILTRFGDVSFHEQLRDVPDNTPSFVQGSSGIEDERFLELVIQRGNFAVTNQAFIGDDIFENKSYFRKATT